MTATRYTYRRDAAGIRKIGFALFFFPELFLFHCEGLFLLLQFRNRSAISSNLSTSPVLLKLEQMN